VLPSALGRVGERCVFWSLQPEGLRARPAGVLVSTILRQAHPGAIVDLHDAEGLPGAPARLVAALPAVLDGLRVAGWELVTVTELLEAG
jgi:peptidoglycan/xylan/chitin deacetylase (PgdA/CDA1 family)